MHKRLSVIFYVLLTVHVEYNRVKKNQLDAQLTLIIFRQLLHVSDYLGPSSGGRLSFKCDGTRAETRFRLSAKRTNPFKSAGASIQSTTGTQRVRISGINAGYTVFRGSVKSTGYPLHSPVSPLLPLPCVTVCHHISTVLYNRMCKTIGKYYYF